MTKKSFIGLSHLDSLDLASNRLTCITPGAFDSLVSLRSLSLGGNPYRCNCHMGWFSEWLRAHEEMVSTVPVCTAPEHLKDRSLLDLSSHDFRYERELFSKGERGTK